MSLLYSLYYGLSWVGAPVVSGYLEWRTMKGHEDKHRLGERLGITKRIRPQKALLWVHAVSIGEAVAAVTLIQAILKKYPEAQALLTTTTVSSTKVVEKQLPKNTLHQYCPVDTPHAVRRFLDHWQPDLAIWIESEFWPNLMHETQERGIPTILLNGRMSLKSFSRWKKLKGLISPLLSRLALCEVQSEEQASFFRALGAKTVVVMGNIKLMKKPLDINLKEYHAFKKEMGERPFWLAASTHPGEEEIILKAHKILQKDHPNLLTILVPRHIKRASFLQELALREGLCARLRTDNPSPAGVDVYIGNTLGEMALFYALAPVVFMGATLVEKGGHNPIEAAQGGAFILHGPHIFNNPSLYGILGSLGLCQRIQGETQLATVLLPWLTKQKEGYAEPSPLTLYREEGLQNLIKLLTPYLQTLREERE